MADSVGGSDSLPFGGDLNKAMRAQDRDAIRVLMSRRDQSHAAAAAYRNAAATEPAGEVTAAAPMAVAVVTADVKGAAVASGEPAEPGEVAQAEPAQRGEVARA